MRVPLSRPDITDKEIALVNEVLRSSVLALGPKQEAFEAAVASYVGRRHGIGVNSGTSGLHLLIKAAGIGAGDEVITTPFSFIASSNCILYEQARPVFVDIEPDTGNIDPALIEAAITPRTRAILPVDAFGQPARLDAIRSIAARHGLVVIEDACEALGAAYKGHKAGSGQLADHAVFAFYPNKQITTGEGGLIVTDDDRVAELCRSLRNQGRGEGDEWLLHLRLGYNYRLDEMSAALGLAQMDRLDDIVAQRQRVAGFYQQRLAGVSGLRLPQIAPAVTRMSWFVYVVRLAVADLAPAEQSEARDRVMQRLQAAGIQCRPYFMPIHLQPFYRQQFGYREGLFPATELAGRTGIALPFFNALTPAEIDYVAAELEQAINSL